MKKSKIWLPPTHADEMKSLARVKLAPCLGLGVITQILELVSAAHGLGVGLPVELEDYQIDRETLQVTLSEEAVAYGWYALSGMGPQRQLINIAGEGLRLIRSPRLLGLQYEIDEPKDLATLEFLLMMRQGIFPTARIAHERAIEISNL